jgi:recombination protein RecT
MASTLQRRAEAATAAPQPPSVERTVAQFIEDMKPQLALALPRLMDEKRFARILITECKANQGLMRADHFSLAAAVMRAAQVGLEPGPLGHCYLLPFRDSKTGKTLVQLIIGYKGIIDLARRSGQIESLYAEVVYDGDDFDYQLGLNRDLTHKRTPGSNRDHITHSYAVARYKDGGFDFIVLDELDIAARRRRSKAADNGPWVTDYAAMARKSAVRALQPFLPLTVEAADAMKGDERAYNLTEVGDVLDIDEADEPELPAGQPIEASVSEPPAGVDGETGEVQAP